MYIHVKPITWLRVWLGKPSYKKNVYLVYNLVGIHVHICILLWVMFIHTLHTQACNPHNNHHQHNKKNENPTTHTRSGCVYLCSIYSQLLYDCFNFISNRTFFLIFPERVSQVPIHNNTLRLSLY